METDNSTHPDSRLARSARPRFRKRWWGGLAGLALLMTAGAMSFSVARAQAFGGPDGAGGQAGPFGGGAFMAHRMHRILDRVGATDSQKSQIKGIWDGLRPQLQALHQQHRQIHQQMEQAMTAPTIDPAQVEKLRQQSVQVIDKTSATVTQGMVATAQVLTPDQRKLALAEIQKHHQQHGHGGDGTP
jgi:Spy/CpxP family protein refolding chaperone